MAQRRCATEAKTAYYEAKTHQSDDSACRLAVPFRPREGGNESAEAASVRAQDASACSVHELAGHSMDHFIIP